MALKVGELYASMTLKVDDFKKGLADAGKEMKEAGNRLNEIGSALTKTLTPAAMGAATGLFMAAKKTGEFAERLNNLSMQTGMSKTRLQELRFISDQIGLSFDTVANSSMMLQRKLLGIEEDSGFAADAMKRLGIDIHDSQGEFRSMDELMPEVIAKLQGMSNETERNALMSQLFGRSFAEIVPLIGMGADEFKRMSQEAHRTGNVLSNEALEGAQKFDDMLDQMKAKLTGVLTTLMSLFMKLPTWVQGVTFALLGMAAAAGPLMQLIALMKTLGATTLAAKAAAWLASGAFSAAWKAALGPLGLVIAGLTAIVALLKWMYDHLDWIVRQYQKLGAALGFGSGPAPATPSTPASGGLFPPANDQTAGGAAFQTSEILKELEAIRRNTEKVEYA